MPMVLITGQKAIRQSRQAHFQIVDVVAAMRCVLKKGMRTRRTKSASAGAS